MKWKVFYKDNQKNKTWIECYKAKTRKECERYIISHNNTGKVFMLKKQDISSGVFIPVLEVAR